MSDERQRAFRTVCGHFATGVTILVAPGGDELSGMTANAFMSVSLDPLLIAVAVHRRGHMASWLGAPGRRFSLSVLAQDQEGLARFYSLPYAQRGNRTPGLVAIEPSRIAAVDGALAWMWCTTTAVHTAGDHWLIVGEAEAFRAAPNRQPLVFYRGRFWERLAEQHDGVLDWLLLER